MKSHIVWHPELRGVIEEVRCIDCNTAIRKLVRSERVVDRVQTGNIIREYCLAAMVTLNTYTEVELEMEDGSRHIIPICTGCKSTLEENQHEALLVASKEAMKEESLMTGTPPPSAHFLAKTTKAEKIKKEKEAKDKEPKP